MHLLGHYKRDRYTCVKMAEKLRELYPEYYYRIIMLCNKHNVPLSSRVYSDNKHFTATDFIEFSENALRIYNAKANNENKKIREKLDILTISDLKALQNYINQIPENSNSYTIKDNIQKDFKKLSDNIKSCFEQNTQFNSAYLYGRDIEAAKWYRELFEKEMEIQDKMISKCTEIHIVESTFDWAGLINKYNRIAVRYYEQLEIAEGNFYNLLIPEVTTNEFSFYDLDEIEKLILENITDSISIQDLQTRMHEYVEDDVLNNNLDEYHNLLLVFIKTLVLKKAIKPSIK